MNAYKIRIGTFENSFSTTSTIIRANIADAVEVASREIRAGNWKEVRNVEVTFDSKITDI